MLKKLRYFSDSFIDAAWADSDKFYEMMKLNQDNGNWVRDFYAGNPYIDSDYEFDFEFEMNSLDKDGADCRNAINLYELFKNNHIGRATIYNEKFLSGFIFTYGYEYFFWEIGLNMESTIFRSIFFGKLGKRRAIAFNIVSRLYRTVEMTVDENAEDKYELTKFVFENRNLAALNFYTYLDDPKIYRNLVRAIKKWQTESGNKVTAGILRATLKKVSIFANITKLSLLEDKDILIKFNKFLDEAYLKR